MSFSDAQELNEFDRLIQVIRNEYSLASDEEAVKRLKEATILALSITVDEKKMGIFLGVINDCDQWLDEHCDGQ